MAKQFAQKADATSPFPVDVDGATLDEAKQRKERTYLELCERHSRARVVLAAEVGGKWLDKAADFLEQLAKRRRAVCLVFFKSGQDRLGRCGGVLCWRAAVLELLRRRSLTGVLLLWVWVVTLLRPLLWWEISAMCL